LSLIYSSVVKATRTHYEDSLGNTRFQLNSDN